MIQRLPRTPFATRLSGDAKETELRIRSIFQWNKQRPPVWLMAVVMLLAVGCGGLVAWRQDAAQAQLGVSMLLQYYDNFGNVAEIPQIDISEESSDEEKEVLIAVNAALEWMRDGYQTAIEYLDVESTKFRVLCYPSVGERYLSILMQEEARTDMSSGIDIPVLNSWVYDRREKAMLSDEQALEMAGVTLEELLVQLNQHIDLDPMDPWDVTEVSLQAFYVDKSNEITLFLVAQTSGLGDAVYKRLYSCDQGEFIRIDIFDEERPLLSADQTERLEKPLWNEWKFSSGMPEGGFVKHGDNTAERQEQLTHAGLEDFEYHSTSKPEFFNDIEKTLSELKNEYPEGEFVVRLDGFPNNAAACFGEPEAEYVYFFFGGHSGDFEKAMDECEDQLKCAGFITTASILFPDMEDDMPFEDFFSLIGVDDYEYLIGEEVISGEGWLRFTYHDMEVMVNTNEVNADGGWDFTGAEIVKRNALASIVDPEILNTNQDLAEAVMFD